MRFTSWRWAICALMLATAQQSAAQGALTDADLADKKFMHAGTFTGDSRGWARNDTELESVTRVNCVPPIDLYKLLRQGPNGEQLRGVLTEEENVFRGIRRQSIIEAFSIGYPIDEIPWDADRHALRERSPYIWLYIENGNYDIDERRNRRVLTLGTDLMDDTYFDTKDWLLLSQRFTIRGRKRWDTATELRRLLIGFKGEMGVGADGIKAAAKVDIRTDSADQADIDALEDFVKSGIVGWGGSPEPATPCRELYQRLRARVQLPDTATYQDVLLLEPKVFLRSIRSRYHLNESRIESVRAIYDLGRTRLEALAKAAAEARAAGLVPAAKVAAVQAWEAKAAKVLDRSLVAERAAARLAALDPAFQATAATIAGLLPEAPRLQAPETIDDVAAREPELKKRQVVAEVISDLYHELSRELDDGSSDSLRRIVARALDREVEDHAEWYQAYLKNKDPKKFGPITTWDPLVAQLRAGPADAELAAYNTFGEAQKAAGRRPFRDFVSLSAAQFAKLVDQLVNEQYRIWLRQLEAAGTAARGIWFDQARELYVPDSERAWGNFLIDTMDFTTAWPASVWDGVPVAERNATKTPPDDKILFCTLANESQIELTAVGAYTARLRRLTNGLLQARGFMKWATSTGQASDAAGFVALRDKIGALPEAEQAAELAKVNEAIKAGGGQEISSEDFEALEAALLTPAVRDGETPRSLEVARAGVRFVYDTYNGAQKVVTEAKGPGVLEGLRDRGGPACMTWSATDASKGETSLKLLKEKEQPAPGPGIIDVINGPAATNTSIDRASALERPKVYGEATLKAGTSQYFKITVPAGQRVRFRISFQHQAGNLDLRLVRRNGTRLAQSAGSGNNETIDWRNTGSTSTTVYLRVYGSSGVGNKFTLETR